jgi:hypothetical protein
MTMPLDLETKMRIDVLIRRYTAGERLLLDVVGSIAELATEENIDELATLLTPEMRSVLIDYAKACYEGGVWRYIGGCTSDSSQAESSSPPFSERAQEALKRWYARYTTDSRSP